ncbi:hypothetical protein [Verrucomicrobium sp. BvORR034]|uniref:hypothetical protein n=1 Tax=Verrucomicrobium sp. BvORR034 TaxID=1396418 RepID=UPI000678F73F|nr:hypothetical protein [Verrucomicrobium sp. BvORR034]
MNVNNNNYNISTTGGLGATGQTGDIGQLDGMTLTQGATAPKKSFKAQVKEFFREIGQFFKSLTQRKATVGEPQTARTGKKGDGGPLLGDGLKEPDFSKAKSFKPMSSGNGGACFVKLEDSTVVIKGGSQTGAIREVYGAQLARELGLPAPETRLLTSQEKAQIAQGMREQGVTMPDRNGGDDAPIIVMEHVNGKTVDEAGKAGKTSSKDLAKSFGKWLAFAAFIKEPDTFHGLVSGREYTTGGGINSSNFMIDPKHPELGIVGIDQNVGGSDESGALDDVLSGNEAFFDRAAQHVARAAGDDADPESLVDMVKEGAKETLDAISKMSPDRIEEMGRELGIDDKTIRALKARQALVTGN